MTKSTPKTLDDHLWDARRVYWALKSIQQLADGDGTPGQPLVALRAEHLSSLIQVLSEHLDDALTGAETLTARLPQRRSA